MLAISEEIRSVMQMKICKVIMESDFGVAAKSFLGQSQPLKLITNLEEDIKSLANHFRSITLCHCNRKVNKLANRLVKKVNLHIYLSN